MSLDSDLFRSVLGRFASGVTVVTTRDAAGHDHGMTVSAFTSLSLTPPLILVCIDRHASVYPALRDAFRGKRVVERAVGTAVAFPVLFNRAAQVLSRRRDMADLLVGVTGDFVPPREVLRPSFLWRLITGA